MKKILSAVSVLFLILLIANVAFAESTPSFTKRKAVIYYSVEDGLLLAQNSDDDIIKGREEFEKTLREYYSKRFEVVDVKPAPEGSEQVPEFPFKVDKAQMFTTSGNQLPVYLAITLKGIGTTTDTYSNLFGAKFSANILTLNLTLRELYGHRQSGMFIGAPVSSHSWRPASMPMGFGMVMSDETNPRRIVKRGTKAILKEMAKYNPPIKYTNPKAYEFYNACYTGNVDTVKAIIDQYSKK